MSKKIGSNLKVAVHFGVLLSLLIMILNFQNCSGVSSSNYGAEGDANSQGTKGIKPPVVKPNPNPVSRRPIATGLNYNFKKNETYSGQRLVSASSFIDTLMKSYDYKSYAKSKAVAVAESGLGYMVMLSTTNQAEANRMAVESCNLLSGDPCALILVGNKFIINRADVVKNLDYRIGNLRNTAFDKNRIPMASSRVRNGSTVAAYLKALENKALAISITGGVFATFTKSYNISQSEANRMALQQCEFEAAISPCVLYAVGNTVVFNPKAWRKNMTIDFKNNNIMAKAPPASSNVARKPIEALIKEAGRTKKYAVYLTPNGYGYFGTGDTKQSALSQASSRCKAGAHASRCIEYATSSGISLSTNSLMSKKKFSAIHCKSVRYSCVQHFNAGCPSGSDYWVQNPRSLAGEVTKCGH